MKKIYKVIITERLQYEKVVEAESPEEAQDMVEEMYHDCDIVLEYDSCVDTEFKVCKASKEEIEEYEKEKEKEEIEIKNK